MSVQALFVPTVLAGYASLVTHQMLDPAVLVSHSSDAQLPAQVCSSPLRDHSLLQRFSSDILFGHSVGIFHLRQQTARSASWMSGLRLEMSSGD